MNWNRAANIATVLIAACIVAVTIRQWIPRSGRVTRLQEIPDSVIVKDWQLYMAGGHARGPENAKVTILEFGDYECPFCAKFGLEMEKVLRAYPTQVRFVYRHWPLSYHRFARPSSQAAECAASQGRFWEMHELLIAKHDSLGLIPFADVARRAGVRDLRAFESCYGSQRDSLVFRAGAADAQRSGGTGTPTVIVNGVLFPRGVDSSYVARLLERH